MVLHLIIKNFGKVESADIALNNLVVFVGNNNSGKTMIMQLIYGIRKELGEFSVPLLGAKESDMNGQYLIRCDQDWFREVELQINNYLAENKRRIIETVFGMSILAEEIKVALEDTEETYFVSSVSEYRSGKININTLQYENGKKVEAFGKQIVDQNHLDHRLEEALKTVWDIILNGKSTSNSGQLFLPASRSGLQLLYKHYFAGEAEGTLVMPIKDFLRFLQLYSDDKNLEESRRDLLRFGEKHLLQGTILQEGDETFYIDKYMDKPISLHIASSMIHELAPFIKALSATQRIDWLYCDEVENSLHPLLQREMARWVVRMANAGIHVIISSHSDTMASRLNNLFMLTQLTQRRANYDLLSELGLKEADLLRSDVKADVYEFRSGEMGETMVEKLEFISNPLMGYDFQLFGSNLDKLYDEADKITK